MALVLLVEDNPANQRLLQITLASLGHRVESAITGEEGWALLERDGAERFDLILLDMHLPGLDGFSLARQIRARFGRQPKVVALTALAMEGDRKRVLDAGCDEYISKPISLAEFRARIQDLLAEANHGR